VTVESVSEAGVGMGVGMAVTVVVVVVWDAAFSIAATLAFVFLAGAFDFPAGFGPAVADAVSFFFLSATGLVTLVTVLLPSPFVLLALSILGNAGGAAVVLSVVGVSTTTLTATISVAGSIFDDVVDITFSFIYIFYYYFGFVFLIEIKKKSKNQ